MTDLQLLDEDRCTILRGRRHKWDIAERVHTKDVYVWALCRHCFRVRLYRLNAPRKKSDMYSATFEEENGVITKKRTVNGGNQFYLEAQRRKDAEQKYFKRDGNILKSIFNVV